MAESLVREGITTKEPDLIAKILADNAAGTPPSTIGRRHEVHHTTVNRILRRRAAGRDQHRGQVGKTARRRGRWGSAFTTRRVRCPMSVRAEEREG